MKSELKDVVPAITNILGVLESLAPEHPDVRVVHLLLRAEVSLLRSQEQTAASPLDAADLRADRKQLENELRTAIISLDTSSIEESLSRLTAANEGDGVNRVDLSEW